MVRERSGDPRIPSVPEASDRRGCAHGHRCPQRRAANGAPSFRIGHSRVVRHPFPAFPLFRLFRLTALTTLIGMTVVMTGATDALASHATPAHRHAEIRSSSVQLRPVVSGIAGSGSGTGAQPRGSVTRDAVIRQSRFVLPLAGPASVVTPFRPPAQRWGAGHRGVDLAGMAGAPVRASGAGVVVFAGRLVDRYVLSIRHTASLRTTYEPVRPLVRVGQAVTVGQLIGVLETGHESCRPQSCLHWGARVGADRYLDPMSLLTGWRVRLEPWDGVLSRP